MIIYNRKYEKSLLLSFQGKVKETRAPYAHIVSRDSRENKTKNAMS